MTRRSTISQESIKKASESIDRTTVMVFGIGDYEELSSLAGVTHDLDMIMEIFLENPTTAIFKKSQVKIVTNPTNEEFRNTITEYAQSRTARGDILILYYSGHGCILSNSSFGFCPIDTHLYTEEEIFPLSVVSIDSVLNTLSVPDIHPAFIVDACFSSAISSQSPPLGQAALENSLSRSNVGPRVLLASSGPTTKSLDSANGGPFTQALYNTIGSGLADTKGKRSPYITIEQLQGPLQEELTLMGVPLSRYMVEGDFPTLPVAKNSAFRPQEESFSSTYKGIILLLWNEGDPQVCNISEFSKELGQGAYANHSKLSYGPWGLVEDVDSRSLRRLTKKGMRFAAGEIKIPKIISKDPITGKWNKASRAPLISIDDVL